MKKKANIMVYALIMGLLLVFSNSCEKDDNDKGVVKKDDNDKGVVKDADGNVYKTVTIDNQIWMAENLKTTKYNDGTAIPLVIANNDWDALTSPGYCWHDNNEANKATYGALYNWHAVNTKKLCPTGWHIPESNEWNNLMSSLGGEDVAGGALKEAGTAHWKDPNSGATNSTGFTALPGGSRDNRGPFTSDFGKNGSWWASNASTEYPKWAWISSLSYFNANAIVYFGEKNYGMSVRCIKD